MVRCSNAVFVCFNVFILLLGVAVLEGGVYLATPRSGSIAAANCERQLRAPAASSQLTEASRT
jgi:hypothetical protein